MNNTSGTFYLGISSIAFIVSAYAINVILARYLGPADYGIYGLIITVITNINLIQTSGIPQALSKYLSESNDIHDGIFLKALKLQGLLTLGLTISCFLLAYPFARYLNDEKIVKYIQFSALIFPSYGIYAIYIGFYNGVHNFRKQAILGIIYSFLRAIFVIFFVTIFHLYGVIFAFIISPLITLLSGIHIPKYQSSSLTYKEFIIFSAPIVSFVFFSSLQQSIDLYFVKSLLGSDIATGYYSANQNISRIPYFALTTVSFILFPNIIRNVKLQLHKKNQILIKNVFRFVLILLVPITIIVITVSRQILELLYSPIYTPGAESLQILMVAFAFLTVFNILASILNGSGDELKSLGISFLAILVSSICCIFLVPRYALIGAAWSTTFGAIISVVASGYFVYIKFQSLVEIKTIVNISIATIVISIASSFFNVSSNMTPVYCLFMFSFFVVLLIFLNEINFIELKKIVGTLIPRKQEKN